SAWESLDLATVCERKRLNAAAARFSAEAFTADPKLADDLHAQHRYNAARAAAQAGAGRGEDAAKLDDAAKAKFRGQALGDCPRISPRRPFGPPRTLILLLLRFLKAPCRRSGGARS